MKRLALILMVLLGIAINANAIDWRATNQATVAWDPVTTLTDGSAIPIGDVVKYRVLLKAEGSTTPVLAGETDQTEYVVTLAHEGRYFVGVQAVRYDPADVEISASEINWSDVNGAATPNPFGLEFYQPPASPVNLR